MGTLTLTNTVADFMTAYTPPDVTVDTDVDYQVTITAASGQSAVAITTNFRTHIRPRPAGGDVVRGTQPSALFNPVIRSLAANGSETPGTVELVADVSDDGDPDRLTFQWSYMPNPGTPAATFASHSQGNPGLFEGYTVAHEGTITLAITDEHNGTTTLHYPLGANQFANAIDHASVSSLKCIVSGDAHTCVLTGRDQVRCWGDNQFGQLGYGTVIDVGDAASRLPYVAGDVPLPVDPVMHVPLDPVMQLVAGNNHTCVLLASGLVTCWGDNRFGQLGYNRTDNLGDDEAVTSFGYVTLGALANRIVAGGDHTCAILSSGALRCWGRNDFGQLGRGNTENIGDDETVYSAGNVDLGAGVTVKDLALGGFHTCALLTTGAVRCWGRNSEGQLGYGNTNHLGANEPINNLPDVPLTGPVRKLVAGDLHTCALTFAGTLRCWGDGRFGQLGQGFSGSDSFWGNAANEIPSNLPGDINTGAQITNVAAGDSHTCALSSNGQLTCWGRGDSGQLGYGNFSNQGTPPSAGVNLDGVAAYRISAGAAHTCALRSNGTARCWGQGADGRLGRGSTVTSVTATGDVDIQIFAQLTVGGTVSGLAGTGLVLRNNGGDDLLVNADGTFSFPAALLDVSAYAVTVRTQPTNPSQTCTVSNGAGNLARANVTNVAITCVTNRYTVGGTVTGLAGSGLVVRNNAGDDLAISGDGSFTFATPVASGGTFGVTVQTQPLQPTQTCTVSSGAGRVDSGNITDVQVTCTTNTFTIGGTVTGLAASDSITLHDNGGDDLARSANGTFTFATPVASGQPYAVTVVSPASPISQTCTVMNGTGTVGSGNVISVTVTCTTNTFTIGGTVTGLAAGDSITLRDNGGNDLIRSANGSFTFATPVASGQPYAVAIVANPTSPISQTCAVTHSAGTVGGGSVTNVAVECTTNAFTIGGAVTGLAAGDSIALGNNGGDTLVRSANGSFTFATSVASGQPYAVTIVANPTSPISQMCTVTSGAGTVGSGNITNIAVACTTNAFAVGGTVSGLAAGDSITLRNNGGDTLVQLANGSFTFATPVMSGQPYGVTVVNPMSPISQTCTVASGAGTIGNGNVTSVAITCTTNAFTVGGTVSGLAAGDSITLRNNGGDNLIRTTNGSFTFATPVASGQPFAVAVVSPSSPISQTCTVTSGAGTVGSGNVNSVTVTCTTNTFTIGGTVTGLAAGDSITLRNNGGDDLVRSVNGSFTFATPVASGQAYAVTVVSPSSPISQTCTIANGTGTVGNGGITSATVTCTTNTFAIGGSVSGLGSGQLVVLQNNGGNNLAVNANGGFTFATPIASGSAYTVTVFTNPAASTCTVTSGSGIVAASNVTSIVVSCVVNAYSIGGSVSGLGSGQSMVLQNNGGNNLTVNANGGFVFTTLILGGSTYTVSVLSNPSGRTCTVSNGSGTVVVSNITNITVTCILNTYSIGGNVNGLGSGQSVVLQNNGGNNLTVSANGGFAFTTLIPSGSTYAVTVLTNPPGRTCTVSNGSGTVIASTISNVAVTCISNNYTIGGSVGGLGSGQSVALQNNGGNNLTVSANSGFTFTTPIPSGSNYSVTVLSSPSGLTCVVSNGSGTVVASNVTNVVVTCTPSSGSFSYSASNTNSATQNTVNVNISMAAGQTITAGTCGVAGSSGVGDTYLRLFSPSSVEVIANDDACGGLLTNFTYTATVTGTYQLRAGCFSSGSCSGIVAYVLSP
jgi:alpha-tubulin suppressor-like RCC1 family protein